MMTKHTMVFVGTVLIELVGASTAVAQPAGFVYVTNCGSDCAGSGPGNVSAYTIDGTTGALTLVPGSPFPAGAAPFSVTVDPTGRFAYVADADSNSVPAYAIERTTGALTPMAGSPFPAGSAPHSVTVDPTGQFAYVVNVLSATCRPAASTGRPGP